MPTTNVPPRLYCPPFRPMWKLLQPAESNGWSLRRFYMSRANIREAQAQAEENGNPLDYADAQPSHYMKLLSPTTLWMTDTPMERRTNLPFINAAQGSVLVAGLGLGMLLWPLLRKDSVTRVVVAEKQHEVIELVALQLRTKFTTEQWAKLTIVEGDIFEPATVVSTGTTFDCIYFDIFPAPDAAAWEDHKTLMRLYRPYLISGGKMGSWRQDQMERAATDRVRAANAFGLPPAPTVLSTPVVPAAAAPEPVVETDSSGVELELEDEDVEPV